MHRFFVSPEAFTSQPVVLTGDQAHQIRRVLRLRLGERVTLLDGQGSAYEAILIALGETDQASGGQPMGSDRRAADAHHALPGCAEGR